MQQAHQNTRTRASLLLRGLRLINSTLETCFLLLIEAAVHPPWFPHRLRGYVHRYLLNRFHVSRVTEYEVHIRSPYDALVYISGRSESQIQEACGNEPPQNLSSLPSLTQKDGGRSPIPSRYDSTSELAGVIHMSCKLLQPKTVVETGVARGATTTVILKALEENGVGHLYSVDLPGLSWGYKKHIGELVPQDLQNRWSLKLGPTSYVLSDLLQSLGTIDIFVHDSAHSYHPQKMDYELALAYLSPGGILISDDVTNDAFIEVAEAYQCPWSIIWQPKANPIAVLSKGHLD